jgi:catechol 2,3-dioxygenase-like lactoylglutathione lyase family enzyme
MENNHITVFVTSYENSKAFYEEVLAPLGLVVLLDWPDNRRTYFGRPGEPSSLWMVESELGGAIEVALLAKDEGAVHSFHNTALAAGARSERDPGVGFDSFAARVLDFDGNSLEAVVRAAATTALRPAAA